MITLSAILYNLLPLAKILHCLEAAIKERFHWVDTEGLELITQLLHRRKLEKAC